MALMRSLEKEQETIDNQKTMIKNQEEIKDLLKKILTKRDSNDSKAMDLIGNVADKLDRMYPEDSELNPDGKNY
jgi:hypothetical protein